MVVDLGDTACARFMPLVFVRLEGAGGGLSRCCLCLHLWFNSGDALVDFCCRRSPHLVRDVGVYVQRSAAGHMADDGGQGLDVHAVFQRGGSEGVAQVVETDVLALGPLQDGVEPFSNGGGVSGGESSLTGEGNIQREVTIFLYSLRTFRTGKGRITLRMEVLVLG